MTIRAIAFEKTVPPVFDYLAPIKPTLPPKTTVAKTAAMTKESSKTTDISLERSKHNEGSLDMKDNLSVEQTDNQHNPPENEVNTKVTSILVATTKNVITPSNALSAEEGNGTNNSVSSIVSSNILIFYCVILIKFMLL